MEEKRIVKRNIVRVSNITRALPAYYTVAFALESKPVLSALYFGLTVIGCYGYRKAVDEYNNTFRV